MLRIASDNQESKHLARHLLEGQLFVKLNEALSPENVKMAVCRYGNGDNDVVYIQPFASNGLADGFDDLQNNYVNESAEVRLVEFVGELQEG